MMRATVVSLALGLLGVAAACGSSGSPAASSDGTGPGPRPPGGPGASSGGPSAPDAGPPPVPRDLPLETPSINGYRLVEVWGGDVVYVPQALVWPPAGGAPFVLERNGVVTRIEGGKRRVVLDFSDEVHMAGEGGALGLALHPQFGAGSGPKPYAYAWYNANGSTQRLTRFTWSAATGAFDRGSESILVEEAETVNQHNGARVAFGPDGFLYFGNGDDLNTANHQTISRALFAGIFRIDVDSKGGAVSHPPPRAPEGGTSQGYFIPNDNPFVGVPNALEEFYALGFRNPFSFSFDRATGALWMGDVGDTFREEVNLVVKGGNYQWPFKEGEVVVGTTPPTIGASKPPVFSYSHSSMANLTAIFGGFVYRGKALPELAGKYVFTDWPSELVWALDVGGPAPKRTTLVSNRTGHQPLGIAEGPDGEIYVLELGGIAKLTRDPTAALVPKTLRGTKLYEDVAAHVVAHDFVPYDVASPLWSDDAAKKRYVSVPPGEHVTVDAKGNLVFPVGTRFLKEFDLPASVTPKDRAKYLETRVMVVGKDATYGLSYRWNAAGTDGDLVVEGADEPIVDLAANQTRTWHYPSFGQCWACHRPEDRILGFNAWELNVVRPDGTKQLEALAGAGVLDPAAVASFPRAVPSPYDPEADLEARATAYLAANCSGCHRAGNSFLGDGPTWNALPGVPLAERGLVGAPHHNYPMASGLGIPDAPLVDPGHPEHSILLGRLKSADEKLRMPPIGRSYPDANAVKLIEQWIASMPE